MPVSNQKHDLKIHLLPGYGQRFVEHRLRKIVQRTRARGSPAIRRLRYLCNASRRDQNDAQGTECQNNFRAIERR